MVEMRKLSKRYARSSWYHNRLYVVRDVYINDRFAGYCEYATANPNGSKKWQPCVEGVEWSAIAPLRVRRRAKHYLWHFGGNYHLQRTLCAECA